jgi:hypothetical protein
MKQKKTASVAARIIRGLSEFADALEKGQICGKFKRRTVTKGQRRRRARRSPREST